MPSSSRPPRVKTFQLAICISARVDRQHDGLRSEFLAQLGDQLGTAHGRGVHAHFIGARHQDLARIRDGPDAAAHGQRNENLARGARHHVGHDFARIAGSGDVEKNQFVRALAVIALGQLHRIARIAQARQSSRL